MKFEIEHCAYTEPNSRYSAAFDADSYDGAEDSRCPIGSGATEIEAITDLCEQIVDRLEARIEKLKGDLACANKRAEAAHAELISEALINHDDRYRDAGP